MLTTDTGPRHIAAAVGAPVVALFGPTVSWRTGPYGGQHVMLRNDLDCSPCFRKRCLAKQYEEMACMRRLGVDQFVEAVIRKAVSDFGTQPKSAPLSYR